ncbi:hypothetical protein D7V80_19415 [Corallococcus sp. CA054B]|uniref:PelD GGDEF domain-containing protein n=1 Tax=Corallococcus sp. CA054B TaxID=2316734 RepID=UPI000EA101B3|nr:GAF domain-containing protein [Corallococcus sp. CA054B]RKG66501.1 hypothetical protein D7V80_19415 [Corallococcus sp. CA054B]
MKAQDNPAATLQPSRWRRYLEVCALAFATGLLGRLLQPDDPFFTRNTFAWMALGPLLAGVSHGFASGLGCALLQVLAMLGYHLLGKAPWSGFPAQLALGLVMVGMVSGEFCDVWRRKLARSLTERDYHWRRLDEFSRVYHLLRVSHDRLEQRAARGAGSLRHALAMLKERMSALEPGASGLEWIGESLLRLGAMSCGVQAASLHAVNGLGMIDERPAARLGDALPLPPEDAMLNQALATGQVVVRKDVPGASPLLAVVPLADPEGCVHGLLAVSRMHFPSIAEDTFRTLALLGAYAGELLARTPARRGPPDAAFRRALQQSLHALQRHGLPASVLSITCQSASGTDALRKLSMHCRGVDEPWLTRDGQRRPVLLVLLPLTDQQGAGGCERRFEGLLPGLLEQMTPPPSFKLQSLELATSHRAETVLEQLLGIIHVETDHEPASGFHPYNRGSELDRPPRA